MPNQLDQYKMTVTDWRKTLRQNTSRTRVVIFLFFLIYCSIGVLVDLYLYANTYPDVPLETLFFQIITFKLFPIATLIMFVIALFSLLISYMLYDKIMLLGTEYREINPETAQTQKELQLYNVIEEMKIAAGLRFMPKIYIIDADYMNAFASGYSERSAMVAITRGLMEKLDRDEMQAVMAHELSHIRHLDIKLTLTASLLANFSLIVLDILFYNALYSNQSSNNGRSRNGLAAIIMILRFLLPLFSGLLLLYLSRRRELMADAGSVELMRTNEPLARALVKINDDHLTHNEQYRMAYQQTPHENVRRESYLYDPASAGINAISSISDIFSTHPSLETRLEALGFKKKK